MLNAFLATGTALLLQLLPAASAVIIYTVSSLIHNLHYPRHPFIGVQKMVYSFSLFPVPPANHCQKKSLEKEKDFLVIGQLPVPRTVVSRPKIALHKKV